MSGPEIHRGKSHSVSMLFPALLSPQPTINLSLSGSASGSYTTSFILASCLLGSSLPLVPMHFLGVSLGLLVLPLSSLALSFCLSSHGGFSLDSSRYLCYIYNKVILLLNFA